MKLDAAAGLEKELDSTKEATETPTKRATNEIDRITITHFFLIKNPSHNDFECF